MSAKHTPGPWTHVAQDNVIVCNKSLPLFQWQAISDPTISIEERDANTKLIAAAPDLLEACRRALIYIEGDEHTHGRNFAVGNVLRAAIVKAEGNEIESSGVTS